MNEGEVGEDWRLFIGRRRRPGVSDGAPDRAIRPEHNDAEIVED